MAFRKEKVTSIHRWTPELFSFTTTRDAGFRFDSGMFTMIGLTVEGRPLLRAYSIASPSYAEHLEFLSIVVPNGPLTSHLQHIKAGDEILVGMKPTGSLLLHNLKPGRTLYLLATGTGLAAFTGLVREPDVYERFERVILVHGVRHVAELAHREFLTTGLAQDEFVGDMVRQQFSYCPTVTREPFMRQGRITHLLASGQLAAEFKLPELDPSHDRLMICGGNAMLKELAAMLEERGFAEGSSSEPGDFVVEKAFADQTKGPRRLAAE
jgi:ferredoxin--NADP+ reductase